MNERFRELVEQAGFGSYAEISDTYIVHKNDLAEFAELIIQECAQIADDGFGSAHFGLGISGQMLKEHFGLDTQTK